MTISQFLLEILLPAGIILTLLALGHCLVTRRGTAWFLITLLLGPLGGLVYLAGYFNLLPFTPPGAPQATETAGRRCPRCQQPAGILHEYQDGRKVIQICQMCKSEMELRHADFKLPL
ncbi:MAG: hypothetical protein KC800_11355 [Candidatus Eremiobacteraeota bacterium]|nr:hypothetical protein [Candidatus Eremiobacteraeota bacterium]